MRYDSAQFGSFDGLDNRKTVMGLFVRMGRGLPADLAGMRRAGFLSGLIACSSSFGARRMVVDPCTAIEAYKLFVAITGCLGVPIDRAAKLLECVVREVEKTPDKVLVG